MWTSSWQARVPAYRNKALKRYGNQCQMCGSRGALEMHHRNVNRQNANIPNLQVLCPACHETVHKRLRSRQSAG